ncbi:MULTISPECIES: hypothetical protein [unclassified Haladaptatus]|uniref:hypothetical protein n=1 Tax=unclassified Haladaptatus TaxID=2622732 RepID=UPI0023E7FC62|nr:MULTISPECIES: hypothetical protein [unclassified Haladaptatus]
MRNSRTPISAAQQEVLAHLRGHTETTDAATQLTRPDAIDHLTDHGIAPADARDHIEQLLLKGYLYEVEDELRLPTQP